MSTANNSVFKKIDSFLFKQIDHFRNDPNLSRLSDSLSNLSEQESKIIQQVFTFGVLLFPFMIAGMLYYGNFQTKKAILLKKTAIEEFDLLSSNRENLLATGPQLLSASSLSDQSDLENRVRNILSSNNIDQSKVNVTNFDIALTSSTFTKSQSVIQFNRFGTMDFSNFLKNLVELEKFKINRIKMTKDMETSLLLGEIGLIHLGRNTTEGF
ncbi:MAG: hypothetical protein L6Q33_03055 [Bacteriovoracaceae bacterium]|jgi:hypothetical protein|nr:hypothetical protein [Bacteriovoracaceae bacterium]